MFEILKTILIGVGVLVGIWILLVLSWTFAIAITESHSQSVTDDSLVKKYEAFLKKFNCKFQRSNFVRNNAEEYWEGNDIRNDKEEEKKRQEEKDKKLLDDVNKSIKDCMKTEDPKLKEIHIASYFDCKGVIRTLEELTAIKDPQEGDKYLVFNQDETVDDYIHNPRKLGIRFKYWNKDWYIDLLRIDISDRDELSIDIKYVVIRSEKLVQW